MPVKRLDLSFTVERGEVITMPKISIIMGIYNCADTLAEAVDCIVAQTVSDWELILCDDGSSDDTYAVASSYQERYPDRIVLLQNERNLGLNATLNNCLAVAKGDYIARMDGDDICLPDRFEKELTVLEAEPNIGIVSSDMAHFDETGMWGRIAHPTYPEPKDFLHETPFCHAPCMVRREAYEAVGGYSVSDKLLRVEDYHLWVKMYAAGYKGKNIHEVLYQMRDDRNAYSRRKFRYRINEARVRVLAVKMLHLPIMGYIYALRPILVGLMPNWLYDRLHKQRLNQRT